MTIGEQAVKWYEQNDVPGGFSAALLRCFLFGVVIKRPDFVLLAEEVFTDGKRIIGFGANCPKNCWWVHYLSTPPGAATTFDISSQAPYPLPYFAFKKNGKTKIYDWEKFVTKDRYGWCHFNGKEAVIT